ncbi:tape measure protein [Klebsiella phage vB_KppS-Raw]|nr:tape measure protein [Klebsiella phage vB_KppS-Raw]CAD5235941.1 tape measure protein [Klebsiella phage vB_KppS-Eggy]
MADAADIVIRVRTDGVAGADAALRRLQQTGVRVETVSARVENGFRRTAQSAEFFHTSVSAVNTVMTATAILAYVGGLAKLSDAWTDVTNKLANANSAHEGMAVIQERVFNIAQRTRTSLESTATLYARMERSLSQYGVTGKEVAQITETINKSMIVSGATSAEATAAIIQFSQGLQSGVLRGDEFRSVMEQAPRLGKMIADGLGVGTAGLREMANTGKLTADVVINAISRASGTIDEEFGRTMPTFAQRWAMATNNVERFAGTSVQVQSVVKAMGDGVELLSNNLGTLTTIVTGVVAAVGGKMLAALGSQVVAMIRLASVQASSSAINITMVDAITRSSVARYNEAQATLAQVAAERTRIQAALAANQQYYKGIATTNALMQNTRQAREATVAAAAAQATMSTAMGTAATASRVLTIGLTGLRTVMGFLGGPLGLVLLAATAWYTYSQNAKQATQDSIDLASTQEDLKTKLESLNLIQQRALEIQLQRAGVTLAESIAAEKTELAELNNRLSTTNTVMAQNEEGTRAWNSAYEAHKQLTGDIAIKQGELSTLEEKAIQIKNNLATVQDNLRNAVMGLTGAIVAQNQALNINISSAAGRSKELQAALVAQNAELDISNMKLAGNKRGAAQLQDAQNRLGKQYAANEGFIKNYISGHQDAMAVLTDEQQGIVEFLNKSGQAYDAQEKLQEKLKAGRQALKDEKALAAYGEQWDKAYERVEARGATGLDRLRIQQEAEVRIMKDKAEKAKATEEELGAALKAIDAKYARQRADLAGQYKPGAQMVREWQIAQQEIKQLHEAGLLDDTQYNTARLNLSAEYYQKRAAMSTLNPFQQSEDTKRSEMDALQAQYDTQLQMAEGNEQQLTAIKENYEKQRYDIQTKYAQQQAQAQAQTTLSYIQSVSTIADSMAGILEAAGAKSSGAYKVMFAMSKAFSISQATLSLTTAILQAMADPSALTPAQKFANYAAVAAAGGALIQQIMGASLTGMAHDGITQVPQEGTWLLQKGERVLSAQQNADFTNFMSGGNSGSVGNQGGTTIVQHITVTGNGDKTLKEAMQQAAKDGAQQGYDMVLRDTNSRGNISRSIGR